MNTTKPLQYHSCGIKNLIILLCAIFTLHSCKDDNGYEPIADNIKSSSHEISTQVISDSDFLGDNNCKQCHQKEHSLWSGSHHDKAMEIADSITVLADFNDKRFISQGVESHFFKKNGEFFVNTEGPDGEYHDYRIVYTFGIEPLQQYIVQFPNGHFQCLRTAWDTEKNLWFDLYPDFKIVHSEWLHWSQGGLNWNNMCADCLSTNVRKNYDFKTHSYNTKYSIINVNCEACHGPGKQHVEEVRRLGDSYTGKRELQMTYKTNPKDLVDQCGRCHMRREQISGNFNYDGTLLDHYFPQLIENGIYYPDGQIKDEVYVYGSFLQSKMYQNNVSCSSCHDSHSLKLKFDGNLLCSQCHSTDSYDTPSHHFHNIGTEGSKCINCHMTGQYYMGNDFRRDHSFRIPRPDLSLKYDTPNACTECHTDKDNKWAWAAFEELFGQVDSLHYSDNLAHGLTGQKEGHLKLTELIEDSTQPAIVRASAVKGLSNYGIENSIDAFLKTLEDDSPLLRATAIDVLSEMHSLDYVNSILPMLNDKKRSVRIKAFYALASLQEEEIPEEYKSIYMQVQKEFFINLDTNSDFVGGRVKRANYYVKRGDLVKATELYESALSIDPINNQLRLSLANLYYNQQNYLKAEETFKSVITQEPEFGFTYYSLGLLYAETGKIENAIEQMQLALKYMPDNPRVYYNLGLLYDKKGEFNKTEKTLLDGLSIDANNESLLYALAFHYYKTNQLVRAKNILNRLISIYPENQQYQEFANSISK